jgi:glycosyltransferase domain-containing protein
MERNAQSTVGLVMPTLNRADFVIRQLAFYEAARSPHTVYIGDSSGDAQSERIRQAIASLRNTRCVYVRCEGYAQNKTTVTLVSAVEERYCAIIPDDDFLFPSGLSKCAAFLESAPEYSTAQGRAILFTLDRPGPLGDIGALGDYWGRPCAEADDTRRRLQDFIASYWVPLFSVHRTRDFLEDWAPFGPIADRAFGELGPSLLTIARGKSRFIDCMYLARQAHAEQYAVSDVVRWLTSPNWHPAYEAFEDSMLEALTRSAGLTAELAREVARELLYRYLAQRFRQGTGPVTRATAFRVWLKDRHSVIYDVLKGARDRMLPADSLSLSTLSRTSSPYHPEFCSLAVCLRART